MSVHQIKRTLSCSLVNSTYELWVLPTHLRFVTQNFRTIGGCCCLFQRREKNTRCLSVTGDFTERRFKTTTKVHVQQQISTKHETNKKHRMYIQEREKRKHTFYGDRLLYTDNFVRC